MAKKKNAADEIKQAPKEVKNHIIDNVWMYTISKAALKQEGHEPSHSIAVNVHKGYVVKGSWIFINEQGKKFNVADEPGKVWGGKNVWYNEPSKKEAILAFAEFKINRLDEVITNEMNLKKDIRTLFEFADFVERRCDNE